VPSIVAELSSYRRWADPLLVQMAKGSPLDSKERLHASLALLLVDPGQVDYLYQRLLAAKPEEFMIICAALGTKWSQELVPQLWALLEHEVDPQRRFRAACALANYDPSHPRWAKLIDEVAQYLITESPLVVENWTTVLGPVRIGRRNSLIRIFRDP